MNDIDKLVVALLEVISAVEKLTDLVEVLEAKNDELETRVEDLGLRLRKLETSKPPMSYPQYSPNEWPRRIEPDWSTHKYTITCGGGGRADSN